MDGCTHHDLRCDELRQLADGWDGPGSKAPTDAALSAAARVIDEVSISPVGGGVHIGLGGFPVIYISSDGTVEDTY